MDIAPLADSLDRLLIGDVYKLKRNLLKLRNAAVPVSEFGRLSLLPAGALPPNPQELLSRLAL